MGKDDFEILLQKEEQKIKELKEAMNAEKNHSSGNDESQYSVSPLHKYKDRTDLYDSDEINVERGGLLNRYRIAKKTIITLLLVIGLSILLIAYFKPSKDKNKENKKKEA